MTLRRAAVISLAVMALPTACATAPRGERSGSSGPVTWTVDNVTVQSYPNGRMKWLYRLRFRETTGVGAVLYYLKREERPLDAPPRTSEWDVRVELGAQDEVRVNCAYVLVTGLVSSPGRSEVLLKHTYLGRDGSGAPFEVPIDLVLDHSAPERTPSLLDFARFTARSAIPTTTPSCETIPEETVVFDTARLNTIHFFIAVDNTGQRIDVRTRWLTPSGKLAHIIIDDLHTDWYPRDSPFIAVRHSVTARLVRDEPGTWNVELFLGEKSYGKFPFQVWREP